MSAGGPGLEWNVNGNRNAKLQHWPFGVLGSLYEVVQNSADSGFSRTTAPGRLGKISICAVLHHFVNRNQEQFKGGPRCRRDGLESRRGI